MTERQKGLEQNDMLRFNETVNDVLVDQLADKQNQGYYQMKRTI